MATLKTLLFILGCIIIVGAVAMGLMREKIDWKNWRKLDTWAFWKHEREQAHVEPHLENSDDVQVAQDQVVELGQEPQMAELSEAEKAFHNVEDETLEPLDLSEEEQAAQDTVVKMREETLASNRGEPEQAQLSFADDAEPTWDQVVKQNYQKRVQKPQKTQHQKNMAQGLVVIHVMAPRMNVFNGGDILEAIRRQGMIYGKRRIFHAYDRQGQHQFACASAVEPGCFDLETMHLESTPGLGFFMDLNQVKEGREAFKRLLAVTHEVANVLGGSVLNAQYQRLTETDIADILAQIKLQPQAGVSEAISA